MPASDVALLKEYTKHYNGGLSGPIILPRALSQVAEAKQIIRKKGLALTLVHCGGIEQPADMVRTLASLVDVSVWTEALCIAARQAASRETGAELREWYTGLFTAIATRAIGQIYPQMTDPGLVNAGNSKFARSPSPAKA